MELSYQEVYAMNKSEARGQLVQTYRKTGSIARTAQLWQTSRQLKWLRRFQAAGEAGLTDRSRRPRSCPHQTKLALEQKVVQLRQATGYGRRRLSRELWHRERLQLSPRNVYVRPLSQKNAAHKRSANTIRHILRRHGLVQPLLPPIVLDRISTDWVLGPGNDLLTHYTLSLLSVRSSTRILLHHPR